MTAISTIALGAVTTAFTLAGQNITFNRDTANQAVYNPTTGDYTVVSPATDPAAFTPLTLRGYVDNYKTFEVNNVTILNTDLKLYCAVSGTFVPHIGDAVTIGSDIYRIMDVSGFNAEEGIVVLWQLQLRK